MAARRTTKPAAPTKLAKPHVISLDVPRDYLLYRDVCSYGYFLLEPGHWDPNCYVYRRVLSLDSGPVRAIITQGPADPAEVKTARTQKRGVPLVVTLSRQLSPADEAQARAQLARMLNLADDHLTLRAFHKLDPRWKRSGRGRLMRSPTLFEDVIKTVTSCNVAWPSTIKMNQRLCEVVGVDRAFPRPEELAAVKPMFLRSRCSVGYRDARIVELARLFSRGEINEVWLTNPATPDEEIRKFLIELPGIGPYAAANILQLLGRYGHLPLDSESLRHGRLVLGFKGSDRAVMKRVSKHFEPFGPHRFRSYWFELWDFYERKRGRSWTWDRDTTGKTFTAAALK